MDNTRAQQALARAIERQDIGALRDAIKQGADINAQDGLGNTPLIKCIRLHFPLGALALGEHGADIHLLDDTNTNALGWAAFENEETVFEWLVEAGGDFRQEDDLGYTAACWVATTGRPNMMNLMLQAGLDPNMQSGDEKTSLLTHAVGANNVEVAVLLVEHGADPAIENTKGRDSWYYATDETKTPLMAAAQAREIAISTPPTPSAGSRGGRL